MAELANDAGGSRASPAEAGPAPTGGQPPLYIPALIDRRVAVAGASSTFGLARTVSDLRAARNLVLLGEPGMGKSTVLAHQAAREGAEVWKVQRLIARRPAIEGTLYLDGLDEYRSEGERGVKAHALAEAIATSGAARWRLSCRSEDWRESADLEAIGDAAGGEPIVVANLLPLDEREAIEVLAALGRKDGRAFLDRAASLGAGAFAESPLSLRLLVKAVGYGGSWPETRFDLFAAALRQLAEEHNPGRAGRRDRTGAQTILAAFGSTCLVMLCAGAAGLRRDPAWDGDGAPGSAVDREDLGLDTSVFDDMLDTALVRRDGTLFEPFHRTVAEFAAGSALVDAVLGGTGMAAITLSRALSMIVGRDGRPPTEMRGLFAWFAAHLARRDEPERTSVLVDLDPFTVTAYGDAAAFDARTKLGILRRLGDDDPYFMSTAVGTVALGGLSDGALAGEYVAIVEDRDVGSHRLIAVLDVLTHGRPLPAVRPALRALALDAARPGWQRVRAWRAWMNGSHDPGADAAGLLSALSDEASSPGCGALRIALVEGLPEEDLTAARVVEVCIGVMGIARPDGLTGLRRLSDRLELAPMPQLFDRPTADWMPQAVDHRSTIEVEGLLDAALAAAIRHDGDLSAHRLRTWLTNVRPQTWAILGPKAKGAVRAWLDADPPRESALFRAGCAALGPAAAIEDWSRVADLHPGPAIVDSLLAMAAAEGPVGLEALEAAVDLACTGSVGEVAYWKVYDAATRRSGAAAALSRLSSMPVNDARVAFLSARRREREKAEARRRDEVAILTPMLDALRAGDDVVRLGILAGRYLDGDPVSRNGPPDLAWVRETLDDTVTEAVAEGWMRLALRGPSRPFATPPEQPDGIAYEHLAVLAGVDRLLSSQGSATAPFPVATAMVALALADRIAATPRRQAVRSAAFASIEADAEGGAEALLACWRTLADQEDLDSPMPWRLLRGALPDGAVAGGAVARAVLSCLRQCPDTAPSALRLLLRAGATTLDRSTMLAMAEDAMAGPLRDTARRLWLLVALCLDPKRHVDGYRGLGQGLEALDLLDHTFGDGLAKALAGIPGVEREPVDLMTVKVLGPVCRPQDDHADGRVSHVQRAGIVVRAAIEALASERGAPVLAQIDGDVDLVPWRPHVRHAQAAAAALARDRAFRHPPPAAVARAFAGGPPVGAADLRAVVSEELVRLRDEVRNGDTLGWRLFWNVDGYGRPVSPRPENVCRDHLLDRLRDRLRPYAIRTTLPEARRAQDTRADILVVGPVRGQLPIEVKRHWNDELWTAAATQLGGYAVDPEAQGFGLYLVLWFGLRGRNLPARPDGTMRPESPQALQDMLAHDLANTTASPGLDVLVFDVSDPNAEGRCARS